MISVYLLLDYMQTGVLFVDEELYIILQEFLAVACVGCLERLACLVGTLHHGVLGGGCRVVEYVIDVSGSGDVERRSQVYFLYYGTAVKGLAHRGQFGGSPTCQVYLLSLGATFEEAVHGFQIGCLPSREVDGGNTR